MRRDWAALRRRYRRKASRLRAWLDQPDGWVPTGGVAEGPTLAPGIGERANSGSPSRGTGSTADPGAAGVDPGGGSESPVLVNLLAVSVRAPK